MVHYGVIGVVMAGFWLLMSGHYTSLLIALGAVSCAFVVYLVHRMDVIDHEDTPIGINMRIFTYLPWLAVEVVKSNIEVARLILDPKLPITPTIFTVDASQTSDIGRTIYATSITLTPGTVTIDVSGNQFLVHAMTAEGARALQTGEMDRRVTRLEG